MGRITEDVYRGLIVTLKVIIDMWDDNVYVCVFSSRLVICQIVGYSSQPVIDIPCDRSLSLGVVQNQSVVP